MCGMLSSLHHFNYAADLLQAVVPLMVSKDDQLRELSCGAIREVLMNDEEGKVAVEAVQLVGFQRTWPSFPPRPFLPCVPL